MFYNVLVQYIDIFLFYMVHGLPKFSNPILYQSLPLHQSVTAMDTLSWRVGYQQEQWGTPAHTAHLLGVYAMVWITVGGKFLDCWEKQMAASSGCMLLMLRVKSVPDPLPQNLEVTPVFKLDAYLIRSLGTVPGVCWYQCKLLLILWLALQLMVTFSPRDADTNGDWMSHLEPKRA